LTFFAHGINKAERNEIYIEKKREIYRAPEPRVIRWRGGVGVAILRGGERGSQASGLGKC